MGRSRAFIALAAAVAVAGCNSSNTTPIGPTPAPTHKIQHVIILLQENRSFDNLFAGFPGADTVLEGPCAAAPWCKTGTAKLKPITLESTGRLGLGKDIDHSHRGFEIEYNHGKMGRLQQDPTGLRGVRSARQTLCILVCGAIGNESLLGFRQAVRAGRQDVLHRYSVELYRAPVDPLGYGGTRTPTNR